MYMRLYSWDYIQANIWGYVFTSELTWALTQDLVRPPLWSTHKNLLPGYGDAWASLPSWSCRFMPMLCFNSGWNLPTLHWRSRLYHSSSDSPPMPSHSSPWKTDKFSFNWPNWLGKKPRASPRTHTKCYMPPDPHGRVQKQRGQSNTDKVLQWGCSQPG